MFRYTGFSISYFMFRYDFHLQRVKAEQRTRTDARLICDTFTQCPVHLSWKKFAGQRVCGGIALEAVEAKVRLRWAERKKEK